MTREEISKKITNIVDYLGALKVEGYKNAKIFVTGLEVLDALSRDALIEDPPEPIEEMREEVRHDNSDK